MAFNGLYGLYGMTGVALYQYANPEIEWPRARARVEVLP
jgi:hypothetical protein